MVARTRIILPLLVPLACNACGLLLTHGPPAGHAALNDFRCTESYAGPLLDVVAGVVGIGFSIKSVSEQAEYDTQAINEILVLGVTRATIWGVSAVIGFDKVSKCIAAQRQLAVRLAHAPPVAAIPPIQGPKVRAVEVAPVVDTLSPDEHVQLVAKAFAMDGGVFLNKPFRWSSSNAAVASVSDSGLVTAHAPGAVLIAANADNVVGTARLVVLPP